MPSEVWTNIQSSPKLIVFVSKMENFSNFDVQVLSLLVRHLFADRRREMCAIRKQRNQTGQCEHMGPQSTFILPWFSLTGLLSTRDLLAVT